MDIGDHGGDTSPGGFEDEKPMKPKALPDDLPRSLDDRRNVPTHYTAETEMYDAWQGQILPHGLFKWTQVNDSIGQSQFLTAPVLAKPLQFNSLTLDDDTYDDDLTTQKIGDSDARLMEMLAAQGRHRDENESEDEDAVAKNEKLSDEQKREVLQKALTMAASNGDVERIERILKGPAKEYVDVDRPDEEGTAPLIYASCFVSMENCERRYIG